MIKEACHDYLSTRTSNYAKYLHPAGYPPEPVETHAKARPSDSDWVEYAEIVDIPTKGLPEVEIRRAVASIVNKALAVQTSFEHVQLLDTADRGIVHARYDLRDCRLFPSFDRNNLEVLRRGAAFPTMLFSLKRELRYVRKRSRSSSASKLSSSKRSKHPSSDEDRGRGRRHPNVPHARGHPPKNLDRILLHRRPRNR